MIKIYEYGKVANEDIFARVEPEINVEAVVSEIIENVKKNENEARLAISEAIRPIQEYLSKCEYNPDEFKSRVRQRLKWENDTVGNGRESDESND